MPKSPFTDISSVSHLLIRGGGHSLDDQLARLRADPPHMVIGTPHALLDILARDANALQPQTLSTLVVDEVDYLIDGAPRKTSEFNARKRAKAEARHPNMTAQILDAVFAAHAPKPRAIEGPDEDDPDAPVAWSSKGQKERRVTRPPPQLVLASATLRTRLKMDLLKRNGWLTRGSEGMMKVTGESVHKKTSQFAGSDAGGLGGKGIVHCVLVVDEDGHAKNIEGATDPVIAPASDDTTSTQDKAFEDAFMALPHTQEDDMPAGESTCAVYTSRNRDLTTLTQRRRSRSLSIPLCLKQSQHASRSTCPASHCWSYLQAPRYKALSRSSATWA
jgi:hypothetical protein